MAMTVRSTRDLAGTARGRRADLGISQNELARRAGVSRKWIYEFEAGKPAVELALVLRVLDALGLTLDLGKTPERGGGGKGQGVDLDTILEEYRSP
jgi:HTH-type transcriptional regulator / antitoxin HipB